MSEQSELDTKSPSRGGQGLRRRDFLALGAATAAASAVATLPAAASAFAEVSPLGVDLLKGEALSVGYIVGSDEWVQQLDLPWDYAAHSDPSGFSLEIVPAEGLTVGSQLANTEVELTVHGLFPQLPRPGATSWKTLYMFASMAATPEMIFGPDPVPFLAWSARMDPQPSEAAKVRPILPTGLDGAFRVGLEMRNPVVKPVRGDGTTKPAARLPLVERTANFTVDDIAGRPKLQEGIYLLACNSRVWDRSWSGTLEELRQRDGLDSVAIGIRLLG
jgi:hypothetical protein